MLPGRPPKPGPLAAWAQGPAQASIQKHPANVEPLTPVRQPAGRRARAETASALDGEWSRQPPRAARNGSKPSLDVGEQVTAKGRTKADLEQSREKAWRCQYFCLAPWRQRPLWPRHGPHSQRANEADGQLAGPSQHSRLDAGGGCSFGGCRVRLSEPTGLGREPAHWDRVLVFDRLRLTFSWTTGSREAPTMSTIQLLAFVGAPLLLLGAGVVVYVLTGWSDRHAR